MKVRIDQSWQEPLRAQFEAPYFETLTSFVRQRYGVAQVFRVRLIYSLHLIRVRSTR